MRRIHYKIAVDDPSTEDYAQIFRRVCEASGVEFVPAALEQMYRDWYHKRHIPARACHPRDIVGHVTDIAKYHNVTPRLTPELVNQACRSYFLSNDQVD